MVLSLRSLRDLLHEGDGIWPGDDLSLANQQPDYRCPAPSEILGGAVGPIAKLFSDNANSLSNLISYPVAVIECARSCCSRHTALTRYVIKCYALSQNADLQHCFARQYRSQ